MFNYAKFIRLCVNHGTTPSGVCDELGISRSAATKWGTGAMPRPTTILQLADYFHVNPSELQDDVAEETKEINELSHEEVSLITAWRKANNDERESVEFALRKRGFSLEKAQEKVG